MENRIKIVVEILVIIVKIALF